MVEGNPRTLSGPSPDLNFALGDVARLACLRLLVPPHLDRVTLLLVRLDARPDFFLAIAIPEDARAHGTASVPRRVPGLL
jgi:hypothetical protein